MRGWGFYRADWPGGSCTGHPACSQVNKGGFPVGVRIAFDSTPKRQDCGGPECLMPDGCSVPATQWTVVPTVVLHTRGNEPFSMQATFGAAGSYQVAAAGSPGAATKIDTVKVKW